MQGLIGLAFVVGMSAGVAQAMPMAASPTPDRPIIQIAGSCGMGFHRGPYGGCRPNNRGTAVEVAPGAVYVAPGAGPCGGMGQHKVCRPDGRCVLVCN